MRQLNSLPFLHPPFPVVDRAFPGRSLLAILPMIVVIVGLPGAIGQTTIFEDTFGPDSRGQLKPNIIQEPPPVGLEFNTNVPQGFTLKNWIIADVEADGPRRSFWVIPMRGDERIDEYAEQAGRSRNSIAYAGVPIPRDATHYVIEFRQRINDNDYIGFILGASEPTVDHDGVEFGYERQLPGTDETVSDIYYRGSLGGGRIDGRAEIGRWADHLIEVRGQNVAWSQNGEVLLAGSLSDLPQGGYFGIRQRYDRGTRYDDVSITVIKRAGNPMDTATSMSDNDYRKVEVASNGDVCKCSSEG